MVQYRKYLPYSKMAAKVMTLLYCILQENAKESVCGVPAYYSSFCAINLFTNQQMCSSQNSMYMLRGYYDSLPVFAIFV